MGVIILPSALITHLYSIYFDNHATPARFLYWLKCSSQNTFEAFASPRFSTNGILLSLDDLRSNFSSGIRDLLLKGFLICVSAYDAF